MEENFKKDENLSTSGPWSFLSSGQQLKNRQNKDQPVLPYKTHLDKTHSDIPETLTVFTYTHTQMHWRIWFTKLRHLSEVHGKHQSDFHKFIIQDEYTYRLWHPNGSLLKLPFGLLLGVVCVAGDTRCTEAVATVERHGNCDYIVTTYTGQFSLWIISCHGNTGGTKLKWKSGTIS